MPTRVGGDRVELAVALSSPRTSVWSGLTAGAAHASVPIAVDDLPTTAIALGGERDQRVRRELIDGVLGQDYLAQYRVRFDGDHHDLWLAARDIDLGAGARARIGRWGDTFAGCAELGCVDVILDATGLSVSRTTAAPRDRFDVVLEAVDAAGAALGQPLLRATLADATHVLLGADELRAWPGAAGFRVVDASPHASPCGRAACFATVAAR